MRGHQSSAFIFNDFENKESIAQKGSVIYAYQRIS